ncbi:MAG: pyroglutamyl-peptidase I [Burkholderiales bacterium]|nr:pyroglutamyl-peptidase I [Burkholderiales bacterium]MBI3730124.1 pyroglutamyl-peptidase I [Burkholderiales bacterium]
MKRILLTGFDPFGGEQSNPSWEVVRRLDGLLIGDNHQIVSARLPCEFANSLHMLEEVLRQYRPAIVICLGQAGGRADISLERIAINVDDARIPDNAGVQPVDVPVVEGGPAAYFTSLPIKAIAQELHLSGIPASVSQTAGTFVCNHVFYGLMHLASRLDCIQRAGFIHIPYLPEQAVAHAGVASMPLEMLKTAILKVLESVLKTDKDLRIAGGATH